MTTLPLSAHWGECPERTGKYAAGMELRQGQKGALFVYFVGIGGLWRFRCRPAGASDTLAGAVGNSGGRVASLRNRIAIKKVAVDPNVVDIRSNQYQRVTEP